MHIIIIFLFHFQMSPEASAQYLPEQKCIKLFSAHRSPWALIETVIIISERPLEKQVDLPLVLKE